MQKVNVGDARELRAALDDAGCWFYRSFMIPPFAPNGKLPPGIHWATWAEVEARFGTSTHCQRLLQGLLRASAILAAAGCTTIFLDGSFVTSRKEPDDFDACWEMEGVEFALLGRELTDYSGDRQAQRDSFGGDLFPAQGVVDRVGTTFLEFFPIDKFTRRPKGIVAIRLRPSL